MTDRLYALAERLGVGVTYHRGGPKGLYVADVRTITLREDMGYRKFRSTFAHELGHAISNDRPTRDRRLLARQENAADQFAAQLLITPADYEEAEDLVGSHEGALALELGTTTHIIRTWRTLHERKLAS